MQFEANNQRGRCGACGKPVAIRDVRDNKPRFCDRKCAGRYRFGQRYTGGRPSDVPNLEEKTKHL